MKNDLKNLAWTFGCIIAGSGIFGLVSGEWKFASMPVYYGFAALFIHAVGLYFRK